MLQLCFKTLHKGLSIVDCFTLGCNRTDTSDWLTAGGSNTVEICGFAVSQQGSGKVENEVLQQPWPTASIMLLHNIFVLVSHPIGDFLLSSVVSASHFVGK